MSDLNLVGIINLDPTMYLEILGLDHFLLDLGQFTSIINIQIVFDYISGSDRFEYLRPKKIQLVELDRKPEK